MTKVAAYKLACAAIAKGDDTELERLIQSYGNEVTDHWKPLIDAAFAGNLSAVQSLIKAGCKIDIRSPAPHNHTALTRITQPHKTIERDARHHATLEWLVNQGADVTLAGGPDNLIPLGYACVGGNQHFVDALAHRTLDALSSQQPVLAALYRVSLLDVDFGNHEQVSLLRCADNVGRTAMHYLAMSRMAKHHEPFAKVHNLASALCDRCGLDADLAYEIEDEDSVFPATPLWFALSKQSNLELGRWLLEQGARPNHCVFAVAFDGNIEGAELLNEYGADWNTLFASRNCLHDLVIYNKPKLIPWLIEHGCSTNVTDKRGRTPLHHAVERGLHEKWVRLLIENGADLELQDQDGEAPKDIAVRRKRKKTTAVASVGSD